MHQRVMKQNKRRISRLCLFRDVESLNRSRASEGDETESRQLALALLHQTLHDLPRVDPFRLRRERRD
jgi:hypothetical protein